MSNEWYFSENEAQSGPISWDDLRAKVDRGEISTFDLVWNPDYPEWVAAETIEGLFPQRAEIVPPPLPSDRSSDLAKLARAKNNHLQATFKLNECQAHLSVYGDRLHDTAKDGLEYIEAALAADPNSSSYLNTKGLLLADGLGQTEKALECLRRALELEPDSITIKQNIQKLEERATAGNFGCAVIPLVLLALLIALLAALAAFLS